MKIIICDEFTCVVKINEKYYAIEHDNEWNIREVELVERISEDKYAEMGWSDEDLISHCPTGCENKWLLTGEELNGTDYLYFAEI